VRHADRGLGRLFKVDYADPRDHPIHVRFDSGEVHHYSLTSAAAKLTRMAAVPRMSKERRGAVLAKIRAVGVMSAALQSQRALKHGTNSSNHSSAKADKNMNSEVSTVTLEEVGTDISYAVEGGTRVVLRGTLPRIIDHITEAAVHTRQLCRCTRACACSLPEEAMTVLLTHSLYTSSPELVDTLIVRYKHAEAEALADRRSMIESRVLQVQ
jgi:hypothetical protein